MKYKIIRIKSNKDYGKEYGQETFTSEDYINLIRHAACCIGNSSSFLKEASVLGVPIVMVGERQKGRLRTRNVLDVPCESQNIRRGIEFQLNTRYAADETYFQPNTSKQMADKIKEILK